MIIDKEWGSFFFWSPILIFIMSLEGCTQATQIQQLYQVGLGPPLAVPLGILNYCIHTSN